MFNTEKVGQKICEVMPFNFVTDHGYVTEMWDTILQSILITVENGKNGVRSWYR